MTDRPCYKVRFQKHAKARKISEWVFWADSYRDAKLEAEHVLEREYDGRAVILAVFEYPADAFKGVA